MRNKVCGIVIGIIVVVVLGVAVAIGNSDGNSENSVDAQAALQVNEADHVRGNSAATVTVIEYGDFQCPYCASVHPILDQVVDQYEDRVQFVFRHFPIVSAHPNAMTAHRSAEAASKQGKFYEMHDLLYERQSLWETADNPAEIFRGYAEEIGLDLAQYDTDYNDSSTLKAVTDQQKLAEKIGVNSTPTFYINGVALEQPPRTAEDLIIAIEAALNEEATPNQDASEE